jgi:hypothetical protein
VAGLVEREQELADEERIAVGLAAHQAGERRDRDRIAVQGVCDQRRDLGERQRCELDPGHRAVLAQLADRRHHRVAVRDLVVAERLDQEECLGTVRHRDQLEQLDALGIGPLQVVEEQHQGMRPAGEDLDELLEREMEPALRPCGVERDHRRLRADDPLERRDRIDHDLAVRRDRVADLRTPPLQIGLALGQQEVGQLVECIDQRGVRNVAAQLIELPAEEVATLAGDQREQLAHQRGLADSRVPGDQHGLDRAGRDPFERGGQHAQLRGAAVQPGRQLEPLRDVVAGQREVGDRAGLREALDAGVEVGEQAAGGLVAILGRLGQQLHHDVRHRPGDRRIDRVGRRRPDREVGMDDRQDVGVEERQAPGQQLEQRDAEGVEIGAAVGDPVHPPGLLGRHVAQRALEGPGRHEAVALGPPRRGDVEVDQPRLAGGGVVDDVAGGDVLVDDPGGVDVAQRGRHADRQAEAVGEREPRAGEVAVERLAADVLEHQGRVVAEPDHVERADHPIGPDRGQQHHLVAQPRQ